jgi:hypothetical protein
MRNLVPLCLLAVSLSASAADDWQKDVGKPAPALISAGWVGTPVSLEAVRGNVVVLAFWNADIPC